MQPNIEAAKREFYTPYATQIISLIPSPESFLNFIINGIHAAHDEWKEKGFNAESDPHFFFVLVLEKIACPLQGADSAEDSMINGLLDIDDCIGAKYDMFGLLTSIAYDFKKRVHYKDQLFQQLEIIQAFIIILKALLEADIKFKSEPSVDEEGMEESADTTFKPLRPLYPQKNPGSEATEPGQD